MVVPQFPSHQPDAIFNIKGSPAGMFGASGSKSHARSGFSLGSVKNRAPSQPDLQQRLKRICAFPKSTTKDVREPLPQSTFKHISELLKLLDEHNDRHEDYRWCSRPRIYSILDNIDALDHMDSFVAEEILDIALPYTSQTLPKFLDDHDVIRDKFLMEQGCVLTDARNLENFDAHVHFAEDASEHILHVRRLGQGSYGWVDEVISNLSCHKFARKRVLRSKDMADSRAQQSLIAEIELMKKLRYKHLTQIVGSYTDPRYIAYLMDPVADGNLFDFLSNKPAMSTQEAPKILRQFFGCLAGAVDYLHGCNIRHRDLKPQNILIKNGTVHLADFGAAYDYSKTKRQTTQDRNVPYTQNYMAPEVAAKGGSRNCASDMWSLGVVFLEIATVLKGYRLKHWNSFRERKAQVARIEPEPWSNKEAVSDWMAVLQGCGRGSHVDPMDNEPLAWIKCLLHAKPEQRPDARSMVALIKESPYFKDFCCDDCIERFEETGFFFEEPNRSSPFNNRSAIDMQIASMDQQYESTATIDHEQESSIQKWLSRTQSELHFSMEEERHMLPIGAAADYRARQNAPVEEDGATNTLSEASRAWPASDKKQTLHASGRFYMQGESDCSESDSSTSELSQRFDAIGAVARPTLPYNIVEDSSSDEFGSLHSDDSVGGEEDRAALATISEDDEEAEPMTPATSADEFQFASSSTATFKQQQSDASPTSEALATPDTTKHTLCCNSDDDEYTPGLSETMSAGTPRASSDQEGRLHKDACTADATRELNPILSLEQTERPTERAATRRQDIPQEPIGSAPSHDPSDSPSNTKSTQRSMANLPKSVRFIPTTTSPEVPDEFSDDAPQPEPKRPGTEVTLSDLQNVKEFPEVTPSEASPRLPTTGPSLAVEEVTIEPLERRIADSSTAHVEIFDPLEYLEQTLRNVGGRKSRATSVLSERSKNVLGSISSWHDRQNKLLEYYCQKGNAAAVKELLRKGSNAGTLRKPRPQPIATAVKKASLRHNKCVKVLIENGCNVNAAWRGKTAIHWAVENSFFEGYLKLLAMLLQAGAEMSRPDAVKEYPLTKLFAGPQNKPLETYQITALALVLHPSFAKSTGVDVNTQQPASLNTALHLAVQRRTPWAVKLLLYRGAKVNAKNAAGTTPLLMAASQWQFDLTPEQETTLVYLLEDKSLEVDATGGSKDSTALHQAAKAGCVAAISLLLERGASVELVDKDGNDALSFCEEAARTSKPERAEQFRRAVAIMERALELA